ncbi:MAG: hypothetical protein V7723_04505 [Sneathiella sp.]|uniref:hypothetical protein n=1 Tax=Sneathiella sp. TaxID=1964365 RepID=UPI0030036226
MKTVLLLFIAIFLSACNTAPKTLAEKCAGYTQDYRDNTEVITNNRSGNKRQRLDADRRLDLNMALKNNAVSDKCDVSNWPAQPDRAI